MPCVNILLTCTLCQAVKEASTDYDALVDLVESIENVISHLDIHTRAPLTQTMTGIIMKVLMELLSALALVTKQIKQKRPSKFALTDRLLL